ncbi:MAG: hypothetical protein HYR56_26705 [Acidobacteria bacterium]|nr:hypothetical protein [Acidobacteriota bacterium]MBI3424623.1 hypothetical protein [Acidobacteriota bacterium]
MKPDLTLNAPGGVRYSPTSVNGLDKRYDIFQNVSGITQVFAIHSPAPGNPGNWTLNLVVDNNNVLLTGANWTANISLHAGIGLQVEVAETNYLVSETLKLKATAKRDSTALTSLTVAASFTPTTGGTATNFTLFDDGAHEDGAANDGVYAGSQSLNTVGSFDLTVTAAGNAPLGAFQHQQAGTFTVSAPEATISGGFTEAAPDADNDGRYDSINWSFAVNVPRVGSYTVFGDLAARDGSSVGSASASVNATVAGNQNVTLVFAGQELYRNGKEGPYLLKNLRITVATAEGERLSGRPAQTALTGGP